MAKIRKKEIKQEIKAKIKMLVSHIQLNCYLSYIILLMNLNLSLIYTQATLSICIARPQITMCKKAQKKA